MSYRRHFLPRYVHEKHCLKYMKTHRIAVRALSLDCESLLVAIASSAGCSSMLTVIRASPSQQQHLHRSQRTCHYRFLRVASSNVEKPSNQRSVQQNRSIPICYNWRDPQVSRAPKGLSDTPPSSAIPSESSYRPLLHEQLRTAANSQLFEKETRS